MPAAYVRLLDGTGEFTAEVVTSATGDFRFFAAPGTWTLSVMHRDGKGRKQRRPRPSPGLVEASLVSLVAVRLLAAGPGISRLSRQKCCRRYGGAMETAYFVVLVGAFVAIAAVCGYLSSSPEAGTPDGERARHRRPAQRCADPRLAARRCCRSSASGRAGATASRRTVREFAFGQRVSFVHDGRPFLAYESRAWLLDADGRGACGRPGARPGSGGSAAGRDELEVVLAANTGEALVYTGSRATSGGRSSTVSAHGHADGQGRRRRTPALRTRRRGARVCVRTGTARARAGAAPERPPAPRPLLAARVVTYALSGHL